MDTYCIVGKLKLIEVEGAKTLQLGYFGGLPYAVSKDYTDDQLYAIFLPDGRLSNEYFKANEKELNFFGKNLKVRSIKLMKGKITSVGYVAPLWSLAYTGYDLSKLKEGDSFNELNGVKVCTKFVNPFERALSTKQMSKKAKLEIVGLPEHVDTAQFYKFASTLERGDLITLTLKLDGTSVRVANALVPVQLKWYERVLQKLGIRLAKNEYKTFTGTRRVIIQETNGSGYYGSHDMYLELGRKVDGLLFPGEAIYAEIVGWQNPTQPLFTRGGMRFLYGTLPGQRDIYVYNIKWTLPNGQSIDLTWPQIKARCLQLGLKHVPEMQMRWNNVYQDAMKNGSINVDNWEPTFVYKGYVADLEKLVYGFVDGPDPIDPSHIREGIVLRVTRKNGTTDFFKAKSAAFYDLEDKSKEAGEVDMEEQQNDDSENYADSLFETPPKEIGDDNSN